MSDESAPEGGATQRAGDVVDWGVGAGRPGSDPLVRRPAPIAAALATVAVVLVEGILVLAAGTELIVPVAAGLVAAGTLVVALRLLAAGRTVAGVAGAFLLVLGSTAFLGALALAARAGTRVETLVGAALVLGAVTTTLHLGTGLDATVRSRAVAPLAGIGLALGVGVALALAVDGPIVRHWLSALLAAFRSVLRPESGFAPAGLLALEATLVVVGAAILRARVPAAAVPSRVRWLFAREATGLAGSLGRGWLAVLGFVLLPVGVLGTTVGTTVATPAGLSGFGPTVFEFTGALFGLAWEGGRSVPLHALLVLCLSSLLVLGLAAWLRRQVALDPGRRAAFLGGLAFALPAAAGLTTTAALDGLLTATLAASGRQPAILVARALLRTVGPAVLALTGIAFATVVVAALVAGIGLLESSRIVPDGAGGLALGCGGLCLAAALAGLAGVPAASVFVALGGTLYTWDLGQYATELGARYGRQASTARVELVHATGSAVAATGAVGLAAVAHRLVGRYTVVGGRTQLVLGFFLAVAGATALLLSLRN
ncbi:MAG: hypothetical protein ABEH56_06785 [Salinirussus sp.]